MRKRLLALLLALAMTASLAACGSRQAPAEEEEPDTEMAEPEQDAGTEETDGGVFCLVHNRRIPCVLFAAFRLWGFSSYFVCGAAAEKEHRKNDSQNHQR